MKMSEAQISGTALPAFDRINAGEVEPAIRALLERSRGEVATLESKPHPTFDNTVLPLEQLCVSPQCGFSSTVEGNDIGVDQQRAKLALCVETAREVWGSL